MDKNCRLCLKRCNVEGCTTISNEEFQQKMKDVFTFTIEISLHLPGLVCRKCSSEINDFHAYSTQVRSNQEQLILHVAGPLLNNLFEVVELGASEKEVLFEEEVENDPENIESYRLIATLPCIKEPKVVLDPVEERCEQTTPKRGQISTASNAHRLKMHRRESTCGDNSRNQRRNDENQRIERFFKMNCEVCPSEFGSFSNLQLHYRAVHNSVGYIRCCDKVLTRRAQLIDHLFVHEGLLRCEVCQKKFKCSRSFSLHQLNSHSKDDERPYKCNKCHQSYPKKHLLTAHLVRHVQEQCTICQKVLSSSQALKVHIAQVHGEDRNQICSTCGKEFRTKRAMDRHIKEHLGVEVIDKAQCKICEKWFNGKYNLKKHIRFIHTEEGQDFQCDICKQKYPNTRALIYHKQRVHVEEKFECTYCGKRFKRKIYLKEHIARHTGQPLYSCETCDATFNSNGNLYAHRRSKHAECRDQLTLPEDQDQEAKSKTMI